MGKFSDLFQGFFLNNKVLFNPHSNNGNIDASHVKIANQMNVTEYNIHLQDLKQFEQIYETLINKDSLSSFREKILPIEKFITDSKPYLAIKEYENLIKSNEFDNYSKNEKFLIYNGLLNCFINIEANEEIIKKWSLKIDALGEDITEIHRYYFLLSIWQYNNRELEKAIIFINKAIKANPNYINALAGGILLKATNKNITYEESKVQLMELLEKEGIGIKDKGTIYANIGDVAFNFKNFSYAKENYIKSNKFMQSLTKEIGIAVCEYFESIKVIKEDGTTTLDNIDYNKLENSKDKLELIYQNRNIDTLPTISRMVFPYLFNILSVTNNHKRILEIKNESMEYIDLSKYDILKHVVEAEVFNGIYDEETFSYLDDYEKVKYQSFYYEIKKDYISEIDILITALENNYQDDKVLQLSLLNALKEDNQGERYIYYYKKFSKDNDDEVFWMNYIQFLDKQGEKDKVIEEIQKLKQVVVNSLVLYDMLALLLDYSLTEELNEFFENVDIGKYRIIGYQMPFVLYNKLMHLLKTEQYEKFFYDYENSNLEIFSPINKAILEVNYYTFKGELDKSAKAYFELFKINENHNDLIKAVELKLSSNLLYDAELYLEYVVPMLLEKPELYYIYYAIILKEKGTLTEAFKKLEEIKEYVKEDLDSPYHQFYTAFCMNNGRTDDAFKYMGEYYAKNPNPKWFKVIQHSEDESGEELLRKLEAVAGGKKDLSEINWLFSQGVIGVAVYNKLIGTNIEEILMFNHYPFTNVQISNGNVYKAFEEAEKINDKILIDANTLAILSEAGALSLLNSFKEVLIPYNTITIVKQRQSGITRSASENILKYINKSLNIKEVPIDVRIKIKRDSNQLLPDDTLDCIALSEHLKVPFLNTEVYVYREFNPNYLIDINAFFYYLKKNKSSTRDIVALSIANLRNYKAEFISFDSDDIFICYKDKGIDGIRPFLRMGKNADYKTFPPAYIGALKRIKDEISVEDFEKVSIELIKFMDKYVGKARYYMSSIIRDYPEVMNDFEKLIKNCSIKRILSTNKTYRINSITANAYSKIIQTNEFEKILNIAISFVVFIIQYLALFGEDKKVVNKYINFIKENLIINNGEDVDYIVEFIIRFHKDQSDNQ